MPFEVDQTAWSGEGAFTQLLLERMQQIDTILSVRVEDAPATRSDADYNFISNELFIEFRSIERREPAKRFGFLPTIRVVAAKAMTLGGLESALTALPEIGAPDYGDEGMLQYLRAERIVPPYQTRGYKLVELVRLYEAGTPRRT